MFRFKASTGSPGSQASCLAAASRARRSPKQAQYPPLQAPETYNLNGILEMVKKVNGSHASV